MSDVSLCSYCHCMTHTVGGYCGKCFGEKGTPIDPSTMICTKRRYKTKPEAEEVLNHITHVDWTNLQVYHCPICHNYHLTSRKAKK